MRLKTFVAALGLILPTLSLADPLGEEASYQLDKSRSRTSTLIKSGSFNTVVSEHLPEHPEGEAYNVHFAYDLDVMFYGRQQGQGDVTLSAEVFTPAYMERLRAEGQIDSPQFKIKHLGMGNVSTRDGLSVENADLVELFDINLESKSALVSWVKAVLRTTARALHAEEGEPELTGFENVKVKGAIKQGVVPVIGVIKADLSGTYSGIFIKAGFDYVSP